MNLHHLQVRICLDYSIMLCNSPACHPDKAKKQTFGLPFFKIYSTTSYPCCPAQDKVHSTLNNDVIFFLYSHLFIISSRVAEASESSHLKLVCDHFDRCHQVLRQYCGYLSLALQPIEKYPQIVPSLPDLLNSYHLEPEVSLLLSRFSLFFSHFVSYGSFLTLISRLKSLKPKNL